MKKRRHSDPANSRERILQVALETFAEKGYSGAGVDDLATRSGIAKTAIYYHFGSKEGLLAAAIERAASAWIEGIRSTSREGETPPDRLQRALTGMRAMIEERPVILKLIQLLALEVGDEKPEIRATVRGIVRKARDTIVEGMREATGLKQEDAELIANVFLALYDGVAFGHHIDPELASLDVVFEEVRRVVMFMVAARLNPEIQRLLDEGLLGFPVAPASKLES